MVAKLGETFAEPSPGSSGCPLPWDRIRLEAREIARRVSWYPTVISAGTDLLLIAARRHDPGAVEKPSQEFECDLYAGYPDHMATFARSWMDW